VADGPLLEIGTVTRPHGIRGGVVVELVTNRDERLAPGSVLSGAGRPLTVRSTHQLSGSGGRARRVVEFEGVGSREAAETLRGVVLSAPALDDPEVLWVHQLIGAAVTDQDGTVVGVVEAVEANPASDLLVLDGGGLIPLHFVTGHGEGWVHVDLPAGLLDL